MEQKFHTGLKFPQKTEGADRNKTVCPFHPLGYYLSEGQTITL